MSDDPNKTQNVNGAEYAAMRAELRELANADDAPTPSPTHATIDDARAAALDTALAELAQARADLRDRDARLERAELERDAWRRVAVVEAELAQVHGAVGVSICTPDGAVVYTNAIAQRLAPAPEGRDAASLDLWRTTYGVMIDAHGVALEPGDWPMARALRGELVERETYSLAGAFLTISAMPIPVRGETWGVAFFSGVAGGLSEASDV